MMMDLHSALMSCRKKWSQALHDLGQVKGPYELHRWFTANWRRCDLCDVYAPPNAVRCEICMAGKEGICHTSLRKKTLITDAMRIASEFRIDQMDEIRRRLEMLIRWLQVKAEAVHEMQD